MTGFFAQSELSEVRTSSVLPKCGSCGLHKKCDSPKMKVFGQGKKSVLFIKTCPNADEDDQGRYWAEDANTRFLCSALNDIGVDIKEDCWTTSAAICYGDSPTAYESCQPNLMTTIKELDPLVIVPMGKFAIASLISHLWKNPAGITDRWVGQKIPCLDPNAWVCPVEGISHLLRENRGSKWHGRHPDEVGSVLFKEQLASLFKKTRRPWKSVPDYRKKIIAKMSAESAAAFIRKELKRGLTAAAFDYECNMLKPDDDEAQIYCASICFDGKRTIAFPWQGKVIKAMREFVSHPVPKIAANLMMEERWTYKVLGVPTNNWLFDTCIGGHVQDNRSGISSLDFQAFIQLGQPVYSQAVKPFLKAKGAKKKNLIHRVPIRDLLIYNGLDSLLTYKVAMRQRKALGFKPL